MKWQILLKKAELAEREEENKHQINFDANGKAKND
jgi:hypothetical protein